MDSSLGRHGPLHQASLPTTAWTTVNAAENIPGLMTPLGASVWLDATESGVRRAFASLGVLPRSATGLPDSPDDRFGAVFFGRFAVNVDRFRWVADLTPGGDGAAFEAQMLGSVRDGVPQSSARHRYPLVAARAPWVLGRLPSVVRTQSRVTREWWRRDTSPDTAPQGSAVRRMRVGRQRAADAIVNQMLASFVAQSLYDALEGLARRAGRPEDHLSLMTGYGESEETQMIAALQAVADGTTPLTEFLGRYGARCPGENELSARSWREDPAPVARLAAKYRDVRRVDAQERHTVQIQQREAAERRVLDGLDPARRQSARAVFAVSRRYIPLREQGKAILAMAMDATRAAARARGMELVAQGLLDDVDDVFQLTFEEAVDPSSRAREMVAERVAQRVAYAAYELPQFWIGEPAAVPVEVAGASTATQVSGMGAAPGVVEGRVRVVLDADGIDDVEPDEVLVCRSTDPSWGSVFHLVCAAVIDIGGSTSHASIIAREMGLPCVINTRNGTRELRTGDLVRVDGAAGIVHVLERAADERV